MPETDTTREALEVERLRAALQAIATHAGQMAAGAMTNRPHTNAAGFAYLAGLATDAVEAA